MRKSELLKALPEKLPEDNTAKIVKIRKEKVLICILPDWQIINQEGTGVIHFTWKNGWATYYPTTKEWTRQMITTLYYNAYVSKGGFDRDGVEAITEFCNSSTGHIFRIEELERQIAFEKQWKAEDRKQKRIDDFMKNVPALPKDFRRFCVKKLEETKQEKISVKLWQPYSYEHKVGKFNYYEERYVERIFTVTNFHRNGRDISEGYITELCRAYVKEAGGGWIRWFYGEKFGKSGKNQHFWDKKSGSCVGNLPLRHYVYDNLDSLGLSEAEKDTLRILDGRCDPSIILSKLRRNPQIEYIAKKGCLRMAADLVDRYGVKPIKVSAAIYDRLKKFDGGMEARELLEVAPKISDKNFKDFCKIKDTFKASMIIGLAKEYNINHIYALLSKTGGMTIPNITEYEDYLKMALRLGMNPNDEIVYRNKRWQEFHARYIEEIHREEDEKRKLSDNKKYKEISEDYELNTALFAWEDENYQIIVPKEASDINTEGRLQHHCVGAQPQYKEKMCTRNSFIVFLRKKEDINKPYYTIECDLSKVIQFYAAYDRQPDKEKVRKVLNKWMKQVKKNAKELSKAVG